MSTSLPQREVTSERYFSAFEDAYFKRFTYLGKLRHGFHARNVGDATGLFKKNKKEVEVIGVQSARLSYKAFDSNFVTKADLTTAVDATSKPGKVRFSVTNSTGATRFLSQVKVKGLLVKRISGEQGFLHDSFQDKRSIRVNGRQVLEVGNNYIQSRDHCREVADWLWKFNRTEKSIYTYDQEGCLQFYQPGQWYDLTWTAGIEVISAKVKCLSVETEISSAWGNRTVVAWGEVEQNWTFDSSYLTKFVISGAFPQGFEGDAVLVASDGYTGNNAQYQCDGSNDEVQINEAIEWVRGTYGGGYVLLSEGTFVIEAAIEGLSGVALLGRGDGTILDRNCNDYTIKCVGGSGTEKTDITIQNMKMTFTDSYAAAVIYCGYTDNVAVRNINIEGLEGIGIQVENCDGVTIADNVIDGNQVESASPKWGINVDECTGVHVLVNRIRGLYSTATAISYGIYVEPTTDGLIVEGNIISDMRLVNTLGGVYGIRVTSARGSIINNSIEDIIGLHDGTRAVGIDVGVGDYVSAKSNKVYNVSGVGLWVPSGTGAQIIGNTITDCGQLLDHANCEEAAAPHITGDGASSSNATITMEDADQQHTGAKSMKHAITATGSTSYIRFIDSRSTTDMHGLSVGKTYILSAWVRVPSSGGPLISEVLLAVDIYDGSWSATTSGPTDTDVWEYLEVETTLTGVTGVDLRVQIKNDASNGEYVNWDDIRFYPKGIDNTHENNFKDDGTNTQFR